MTLGSHLAAATPVRTSAGWLVVARLRLSDYALLLTAAADALGHDDDGGHGVEFGADATIAWAFGDGLPMLLWLALRRDRPGMTIEDAEGLTLTADDAVAVTRAAFRRAKQAAMRPGEGKDIAAADWGPTLFFFLKHHHTFPSAVGDLTLDQLHSLMSKGDDGSSKVLQSDMQTAWVEMMKANRTADEAAKVSALVPVTLEDLGFRVVPESGGDSTNGEVIDGG